jgi:hypothetical protein
MTAKGASRDTATTQPVVPAPETRHGGKSASDHASSNSSGIEAPWEVERVELKLEKGEVHIYLDHAKEVTWLCPECSAPSPLHDH